MLPQTADLLAAIRQPEADRDFIYTGEQALFSRWRRGQDVGALVALLTSDKTADRAYGAYLLGEVGCGIEGLLPVVCGLAEDPIAQCRRAFVIYIQASAGYGSETANAMAARLCDLDLFVRLAALKWASGCSAADFADLCDRVAAGAGLSAHPEARGDFLARVYADLRQVQRTRLFRAIDIARRLRAGETPTTLRQAIPEEDSWLWDMLVQKFDRPATPRRPHQRGDQPGAKQF